MGWPVSASHSRTVPSTLAVASRCPSGLNATPITASVWPVSGCADGLAGVGVPQPHRAVVAGGGQPVPVGAERHTEHRVGVAGERVADGLAGVGVPQPHRAVVAGGGQPVPVGAERHTAHRAGVAGERGADGLAGVGVPQPHRVVAAGGGQPVPVGAERHTVHRVLVWPVSGAPIGWPVSASHSRTVSSSLAVASRCPSGLNATPSTASVCGDDLQGAGPLNHRAVERRRRRGW